MDVICCNCDFVYRPRVLQLQQKSDPAKSGSGRILGVGYPNLVSGTKSISVHPYTSIWSSKQCQCLTIFKQISKSTLIIIIDSKVHLVRLLQRPFRRRYVSQQQKYLPDIRMQKPAILLQHNAQYCVVSECKPPLCPNNLSPPAACVEDRINTPCIRDTARSYCIYCKASRYHSYVPLFAQSWMSPGTVVAFLCHYGADVNVVTLETNWNYVFSFGRNRNHAETVITFWP